MQRQPIDLGETNDLALPIDPGLDQHHAEPGGASISQSKADADQKLKMAEQAVQIAQNRAAAEAGPLIELGRTLALMHAEGGKPALDAYLRNASLPLRERAAQTIVNL